MARRDLTNLKSTGGAILRLMKYASTPSELAACGKALHQVIDLYEHGKKASRSRSVPEAPKVTLTDVEGHNWEVWIPVLKRACVECGKLWLAVTSGEPCPGKPEIKRDDTKGHAWSNEAPSERVCQDCGTPWRESMGTLCPSKPGKPKAQDTDHVWDTAEAFARKCRVCGASWTQSRSAPSTCPGKRPHEWTLVEGRVRCCKCQTQQTKAATLEGCPGKPDPLQKTHPSHSWIPGDPGDGDCGHCGAGRRGKLAREPCKGSLGRHDWVVQPTGRPKCSKCGKCQREGRQRRCTV